MNEASGFVLDGSVIVEVCDVHSRNRNVQPARASGYVPPLTRLRQAVQLGRLDLTRRLTPAQLDPIYFCEPKTATVHADFRRGRPPYVWFLDVRYRAGWLTKRVDLVGRRLELKHGFDLREIAMFEARQELGRLRAEGRWGVIPHDYRIRKMFMAMKKDKRSGDEPFTNLLAELRSGASSSVRKATDLAYLIAYLESRLEDPDLVSIVDEYKRELAEIQRLASLPLATDESALRHPDQEGGLGGLRVIRI